MFCFFNLSFLFSFFNYISFLFSFFQPHHYLLFFALELYSFVVHRLFHDTISSFSCSRACSVVRLRCCIRTRTSLCSCLREPSKRKRITWKGFLLRWRGSHRCVGGERGRNTGLKGWSVLNDDYLNEVFEHGPLHLCQQKHIFFFVIVMCIARGEQPWVCWRRPISADEQTAPGKNHG